MTQPAYFNVHGEPLTLSAKEAVLAREPNAYAEDCSDNFRTMSGEAFPLWRVSKGRADGAHRWSDSIMGSGATEEAAWLDTLSRMRIADNAEDEK